MRLSTGRLRCLSWRQAAGRRRRRRNWRADRRAVPRPRRPSRRGSGARRRHRGGRRRAANRPQRRANPAGARPWRGARTRRRCCPRRSTFIAPGTARSSRGSNSPAPSERWGAPFRLFHRADLQQLLLAAARRSDAITIRAGARVGDFEEGDGAVFLRVHTGQGPGGFRGAGAGRRRWRRAPRCAPF